MQMSLWPILDKFWCYAQDKHGTSAVSSCSEPVKKLAHPCGAGSIFGHNAQTFKNFIHRFTTGKQYGGTDNSGLMKCSESIKVTVKSLVFTVPLKIKGHTVLYIIYLVAIHEVVNPILGFFDSAGCMCFNRNNKIAPDSGFKPISGAKDRGQFLGYLGLITALCKYIRCCDFKFRKSRHKFSQLFRASSRKDFGGMTIIMNFVFFKKFVR